MHHLARERNAWKIPLPSILQEIGEVQFVAEELGKRDASLRPLFPYIFENKVYKLKKAPGALSKRLKVGVLFSGGPAPGGHNVIAGIMQGLPAGSELIGFLGGASALLERRFRLLQREEVHSYLNMGGFDLLGSGRTKIETAEQLAAALRTCKELGLDGLVVIGGDDSNTNAAVLAEFFCQNGCKTRVIGVPKTIDGDLQAEELPISFGFDTACKTYSELIGNIARDALSSRKYVHFIKLMGRSASHIALECALSTQPNLTLIGEEKKSLAHIVEEIASLIERRQKLGKEYGVILIPEGLIEFIPEMKSLISSLNELLAKSPDAGMQVAKILGAEERAFFATLPEKIQEQLVLDRDPHGNVRVSQIDTEVLLIELVKKRCKFSAQNHFLGYEGRAAYPSNFDASYCYALGLGAALAIRDGLTAALIAIPNLQESAESWQVKALPILSLMGLERRKGKDKPVISKALVNLQGKPFQHFARLRKEWGERDDYLYPGPMQFFGSAALCNQPSAMLLLN